MEPLRIFKELVNNIAVNTKNSLTGPWKLPPNRGFFINLNPYVSVYGLTVLY